jgi:hypothetical protein
MNSNRIAFFLFILFLFNICFREEEEEKEEQSQTSSQKEKMKPNEEDAHVKSYPYLPQRPETANEETHPQLLK